jgi:hypothetical protein
MEIRREDLEAAARRARVTDTQADALWSALSELTPAPVVLPPRPHRTRIALWEAILLGAGLVAALPAAWLLVAVRDRFGGPGGAIGSALASAAFLAGAIALRRRHRAGAGVLLAAALALVPFAVHCLMHALGRGDEAPPTDFGEWLADEDFPVLLATAAATAAALRAFRFPVLAAVLAAVLWFAAMDAAPVLFGAEPTWTQHALLSALVGLLVLGAGFAVDRRLRQDYAGWLYLAGLVSFWGGLTTAQAASRTSVALYVAVQVWLLAVALLVHRRRFAVLGAVGLAGAAGHLAADALVADVLPWAFAFICAALVAGTLAWMRWEERLADAVIGRLPPGMRRLLPPGVAR